MAAISSSPKQPDSIWKKHDFIILIDAPFKLDRNKQNSPKPSRHCLNNHQLAVKLLASTRCFLSIFFYICYDICWRFSVQKSEVAPNKTQSFNKVFVEAASCGHHDNCVWRHFHISIIKFNNIWHCNYWLLECFSYKLSVGSCQCFTVYLLLYRPAGTSPTLSGSVLTCVYVCDDARC